MALGNSQMVLAERQTLREGDVEISERAFNLIIGGMLLYGFVLNYLTVALFAEKVIRLVSNMSPWVFLIGYFVLVLAGNFMVSKGGPALSFVGYTLIAAPIGMVLCLSLSGVPVSIIKSAVLITAIVTLSFIACCCSKTAPAWCTNGWARASSRCTSAMTGPGPTPAPARWTTPSTCPPRCTWTSSTCSCASSPS